jgi:general secretion pathway protein D
VNRRNAREILLRVLWALPLSVALRAEVLFAQPATAPATAAAGGDAPVAMDFPAEGVELKTLVNIVTKRLHIPILYDESVLNKRVIVRVPVNVPESALLGVLQSALRMNQLAMVDAEQPGWKQIVPAGNLAAVAKPAAPGAALEPGTPVTQVFTLKRSDPNRVIEAIRPLLTQPGGNVVPIAGTRTLVVSDYPSALKRVNEMLDLLDAEGAGMDVQFIPVKQADAAVIAPIATALVNARDQAAPGAPGGTSVLVSADERTNQVIVVAPATRMDEIRTLIANLDKPLDLQTKVYKLKTIAPERIDKLIKNLLGAGAKRTYQATVDRDSQSLVASATPDVHERIGSLVKELDVAVPETQSPIRFYKLKNTKAADVLATIAGLYPPSGEGQAGAGNLQFDETTGEMRPTANPPTGRTTTAPGPASTTPPARSAASPAPVTNGNTMAGVQPPRDLTSLQRPSGDTTTLGGGAEVSSSSRYGYNQSRAVSGELIGDTTSPAGAVHTPNATVAADANTNSIIVIAPPAVQQTYAELIKRLDERRPQVQIECTIVTLDTTDGSNFAVDISKLGGFGTSQLLTFSSFGVSTVDPKTGTLTPVAAQGGTAALLSPRIADVVIRALATHSRSRLLSAPQLLVNDNGKGKLASVAQQPFAEILDTASVQSRTGLGGQAEAGTTITVEPQISQDDDLQLSYSVELSAFTGQATAGLPPPSQKNTIDSTVTIPDGYTIVVGGLTQKNYTSVLNSLPILDQIPVVNLLFGSRSVQHQDTTLFVFIRPVILRDDKFDDLKYLSDRKVKQVGLPGPYPSSEPIPIK